MAPSPVRILLAVAALVSSLTTTADAAPAQHRSENSDNRGNIATGIGARVLEEAGNDGRGDEDINLVEGIVFQKRGCPQVISEEEAGRRSNDTSLPGNVVYLTSAGTGRTGNHFLVVSAYFALAYCCKSKVLRLPLFDPRFPSLSESGGFESHKRFFDFSGVDMMPLEEYEGMFEDPNVCQPEVEIGGIMAFHLNGVHPHLLECMNRVYLRGCEAEYLEPLLGTSDFCEKPPASGRRLDKSRDEAERQTGQVARRFPGALAETPPITFPTSNTTKDALANGRARVGRQRGSDGEGRALSLSTTETRGGDDGFMRDGSRAGRGAKGSAGSLVMHIRSGDIFLTRNAEKMKNSFPGFGQPPLQFYLRAIASQPWSDVTILTFALDPVELNPTFAALEMMQLSGLLGPNVALHKDRDLLKDIQSMLCADGLAISRSTLHFLTFGHTRAKHYFLPSECGPGTYTRKTRKKLDGTKKPSPNNTTLLCIEKPEAEVYGVEWDVDEDAYGIYNGWQATDEQLLDMVLFDGIKGLVRCCS